VPVQARKPWIAALLSLLCPGLGHVYLGQPVTKLYARVLRPGFHAHDCRIASQSPPPLRTALAAVDAATERLLQEARLVA
jgi:hypothetical protein